MVNFKIINGYHRSKPKINYIYELLNIPFNLKQFNSIEINTGIIDDFIKIN